jgi:hypothetical protein
VTGLAWLPDGSALLFAERAAPGAPPLAGGLVAVGPDGSEPRVVASAGRVAPVAEIVHFAPSPDGRSVAYSVAVPSPDGPAFHSLWLRPLAGGQALPLAVPPDETVTDLWWTPSGLVFRAVPFAPGVTAYAGGRFALYRATVTDAPERLFATDAGTPAASPGADSPLPATPPASPVARSRPNRLGRRRGRAAVARVDRAGGSTA